MDCDTWSLSQEERPYTKGCIPALTVSAIVPAFSVSVAVPHAKPTTPYPAEHKGTAVALSKRRASRTGLPAQNTQPRSRGSRASLSRASSDAVLKALNQRSRTHLPVPESKDADSQARPGCES